MQECANCGEPIQRIPTPVNDFGETFYYWCHYKGNEFCQPVRMAKPKSKFSMNSESE